MGLLTFISCGEQQGKKAEEPRELVMEATPKGILESANKKIGIYDFDGLERLLERKDDKVYVVNFWATWCKPCVEELPHFEQLNDKYAGKNVEVVLVSLDFPSRAEELLLSFVEKKNIKSDVLLLDDPKQNTWIPKVDPEWSGAIPATLIFNKDRKVFYEKSFNFNQLESELLSFIN
jgi:thiol-disulfide isomerase/thioredoxin